MYFTLSYHLETSLNIQWNLAAHSLFAKIWDWSPVSQRGSTPKDSEGRSWATPPSTVLVSKEYFSGAIPFFFFLPRKKYFNLLSVKALPSRHWKGGWECRLSTTSPVLDHSSISALAHILLWAYSQNLGCSILHCHKSATTPGCLPLPESVSLLLFTPVSFWAPFVLTHLQF